MFRAGIMTISDKGAQGQRIDKSGELLKTLLSAAGCEITHYEIVPDEQQVIATELADWAEEGDVDVIFTTGGTGLSPRDVTPEATMSVVDYVVPGFGEAMRTRSLDITPMAMLSRATAGVKGKTLIINLPGSPKAAGECLDIVLPAVQHAVDIVTGAVTDHDLPGEQVK